LVQIKITMKIPTIEKSYLKVYGTYGVFSTPNSKYTIRVFSTFASKSKSPRLLEELKPMRERIASSKIKDLGSLLQRDLNDNRVAKNLIPYLLGQIENPTVAFFPSVLGVLMPKEFINDGNACNYPVGVRSGSGKDSNTYHWDDKWYLELFPDEDGAESPLGMLNIDLTQTEIVVIDGQHRANAFRVATDTFPDIVKSTYKPFYDNVNLDSNFNCDLPVTIIWFENTNGTGIDPNLISRRLFIDVNNSAKSVSNSRKILLNDRDPIALMTRFFYSKVAEYRAFNADSFSLLHSAFDSDSDISSGESHVITITNPEIMYDVFDKLFFRSDYYITHGRYLANRNSNTYELTRFGKYFGGIRASVKFRGDDEEDMRLIFDESRIDDFKEAFYTTLSDVFLRLFDAFPLFKIHFSAARILSEDREYHRGEWSSETRRDVWDKVFCGGEGLYYSYKSIKNIKSKANSESPSQSQALRDVNTSITNIETEFKKERFKILAKDSTSLLKQPDVDKAVDKAYQSLNSKAFQIGYFRAFIHFSDKLNGGNLSASTDEFITRLNRYSHENWVHILTDLKSHLIGDADPKSWPAYHKLILRLIQSEDEKPLRFHHDSKEYSPEAQIYRKKMMQWVKSHLESQGLKDETGNYIYIDKDKFDENSKKIIKIINEVYLSCGIEAMDGMDEVYDAIRNEISLNG